ncbi:MAG TPA: farnesyl diphosphate synthase [Verrucomicrobiales bacterium]|nr:farnesyl diphosphate synthase [Verrucomicrobiales bacterium]
MDDFAAYLKTRRRLIDAALKRALPPASAAPRNLHRAMRYSMFAGGKRLRPVLCLAAADACAGSIDAALPLACAVECIHTYSLIHDDLPCMDDDDLRRGHPTCHRAFGEALAVLAGDALQPLAFELAAGARPTRRYPASVMVAELARAAGSRHLVAGQVLDLDGEGCSPARRALENIHMRKTGALLTASLRLGAMSANAAPGHLEALTRFGQSIGLAFQVVDDILDATQTTERLGKSAGKDKAAEKATYPALLGLDRSRKEAQRLTTKAVEALAILDSRAEPLRLIAGHMLHRDR